MRVNSRRSRALRTGPESAIRTSRCATTCGAVSAIAAEWCATECALRLLTIRGFDRRVAKGRASVDTLDNPQLAVAALAERAPRFLICRTVVRGDRLRDAVELDHDGSLFEAQLVHLCRQPAREKTPARPPQRGSRELGVRRERRGVVNRAIEGDPIRFGHDRDS